MLSQVYLTFLQVVQSGSFAKASKKLFVSPVSVMKQMNNLEDSLDLKLFIRNNRGIKLTKAGRFLYSETIKIKQDANSAINEAKAIGEQDKVIINLGASFMRPADQLINIWRQAGDNLKNYNLRIVSFNDQGVTVKSPSTDIGNKIDCIVGPCDANQWSKHYSIYVLGYECFKIAVPLKSRLAQKKKLSLNDLDGETLIMPPLEASVVRKMCNDLNTTHPTINIINTEQYFSPNTFNEYADDLVLTRESFENLSPMQRALEVDWNYKSPYGVIYAKHPSEKMKDFIAILKQTVVS
ncbi:LysR family transcriptional regulator [Companilactobacillus sp. HBUAS56275]|uniref:LysR family transcriptional regulator n=1 Tax=Candidatus Companilactobacillus pullicola TaxID=2838523 RepID=A0A9D2CNJ1_9LACO|nr:LysR family transcriptional regulator [Candidatus Companilactobacillus pullicola]